MAQISLEQLIQKLNARVHTSGDGARIVERVSVGDLLSFVMGSDSDETAWVTIQTHLNVAAVAVLKDMPLVIIASGRLPADDLVARCETEGIALVTVSGSIFDTCVELGRLGLSG